MSEARSGAGAQAGGSAAGSETGGGGAGGGATGGGAAASANGLAEFLGQIPEDIRGEAYFRDIKDVPNLAKKAFNQAKLIGRDPESMVVLPGSDDPAQWADVWNRLGRPANADGYHIADPADLPQGLTLDRELQSRFTGKAHEIGLNNRQAQQLFDWWNGERRQAFDGMGEAEKAGRAKAEDTLKREWGHAYAEKLGAAERTVQAFDQELKLGGALAQAFAHMPWEARPALAQLFAYLDGSLSEPGELIGAGGSAGQGGTATPAEARQRINANLADPQFNERYMNRRHPGHQDAVRIMRELHEALTPPTG